jgi:hypothetical protein
MHLDENTILRRSTTVVSREIAAETLVVPIRGGVGDLDSIFSFNPIGSDLWKLLAENTSIGDLASWVEDHYEVSRQTALRDIEAFLGELVEAGLASIAPVPVAQSQTGTHASS